MPPEEFDVQAAYQQLRADLAAAKSMLAGTEDNMTATRNYSSGELLSVSGTLYAVTAAIPSGGAITLGVNVTPTTMAAQPTVRCRCMPASCSARKASRCATSATSTKRRKQQSEITN